MLYMKKNKSVSNGDFGPAKAEGRSQTWPVEPLGIDLVAEKAPKFWP